MASKKTYLTAENAKNFTDRGWAVVIYPGSGFIVLDDDAMRRYPITKSGGFYLGTSKENNKYFKTAGYTNSEVITHYSYNRALTWFVDRKMKQDRQS